MITPRLLSAVKETTGQGFEFLGIPILTTDGR